MKTSKATLTAFASEYSPFRPDRIGVDTDEVVVGYLSFFNRPIGSGWTRVGTAEITVTFDNSDTITLSKIESLREEKKRVLAAAEAKATSIEGQIQSLLALPYKDEA